MKESWLDWDKNEIVLDGVSEKMWIASFPISKEIFWNFVVRTHLDMCFQFELYSWTDYKLRDLDENYVGENFVVTLLSRTKLFPKQYISEYEIEEVTGNKWRFFHVEFYWPDGDVPDAVAFSTIVEFYLNHSTPSTQMLSHCMGGHGRSGTFVYVIALLRLGIQDANELLSKIRQQREGAVENSHQKSFAIDFADKFLRDRQLLTYSP